MVKRDSMIIELTLPEMAPEALPQDDYMNVIMFFGAGCGPCKATMPNYEEASAHFESLNHKIRFYKFNVWQSPETIKYCADIWGVNGVPQFKLLLRGQVLVNKLGGGDLTEMQRMTMEGIAAAYTKFEVSV